MNQKAWEFYKQITQGLVCENIKKKHIVSHSLTMYELTKACEWVPRSGMPNNLPAATLLSWAKVISL